MSVKSSCNTFCFYYNSRRGEQCSTIATALFFFWLDGDLKRNDSDLVQVVYELHVKGSTHCFCLHSIMAQLVLKVNPAINPVPWGPLMLASLVVATGSTSVVETKFDPDTPTLALTSANESIATDPIDIVSKIGAAAELPDDSSKVCYLLFVNCSIDRGLVVV